MSRRSANRPRRCRWMALILPLVITCLPGCGGNTNDDGVREGYEVCARSRSYGGKDFLLLD